jgi:GWxTD domain-containing protein
MEVAMSNLSTSGFSLNRMVFISKLLFLLVISLGIIYNGSVYPQLKNKSLSNLDNKKEFFYVDPLVFYTKDSSAARLDVYIEVPMENLQFKWDNTKKTYESAMDFDIVITNPRNEVVIRESFSNLISNTKEQHKQVSKKSEYITKHFNLVPGKYGLSVNFKDNNLQAEHSKNLEFEINDFANKEVGMSDLMIVSDYKSGGEGKKTISPLVNNNIGSLKDFYLFFEVYNNQEYLVKKDFTYKVIDNKNNEVLKGRFDYLLQPGVNQKVEKFSTKDLLIGDYKLQIEDAVSAEVLATKDFDFKWNDMPATIQDLDLAISQTIYIATTDEFDSMKDAKSTEDKQRKFIKFWRDKDPSPNTSKNEMMIEYYNRIKIANERYSNYFDGWKSDMGMVYIIYGDPTSIERYPFSENSKPYEVWDYYEINRRFVFVDNTGFGDYRLTAPIWDQERRKAY